MNRGSTHKLPHEHRVLAVHAHPDDVEFQCAGTLAILRGLGCPIVIATMTAGDGGSVELSPQEISQVRRAEARASAQLLGAEYACLELCDLRIDVTDDARRRVTELVRRARPDIILTAPPVDYMSDHEMTSRLVREAAFNASVRNFATLAPQPAPILAHVPHLYYVDSLEGVDIFGHPVLPDFYIDVSATFETKKAMLACHASQRQWLAAQHGIDEYLDSMERWSRRRGEEIGVEHAEAFRQHRGHAYPRSNLLLRLVAAVQEQPTKEVRP
ncbi:MAG TPA: PIG-L family deacetylase [Candidatus Limnocylindrales bacterium]|nr:PIG-L family deacetylase [Candidatus Limnocylindrales bacterium]